jgi:hypothetical protein
MQGDLRGTGGVGIAVLVAGLLASSSVAAALGGPHSEQGRTAAAGLTCLGRAATITGGDGNDRLGGTRRRDVIVALGGDDEISAAGGADLVCAGAGDDIVAGEGGRDRVSGAAGEDRLLGGNGDDRLYGGRGRDACTGGTGDNILRECEARAPRDTAMLLTDAPPVASPDSTKLVEDAAATTVSVLANDIDEDGGLKRIESATQGNHGTVALVDGGGALSYRPAADYCGRDSFVYTLNGGSSANVSATVQCVDDRPEGVADSVHLTEDDPATAIDVLANDTDVDGGPMDIASSGNGAHGTVVVTGDGTGLTYRPAADYCGRDSFVYTLNGGSTATVSATVQCVDDLPEGVADSAELTEDDPATAIDVLANDTDVDGGPMDIASSGNGAHGTVVITGGGIGLSYHPEADYCGPDSFAYVLNGGSVATVSVIVACVDDAPVAIGDSFDFTEDDSATAIDVLANDTDIDEGPMTIAQAAQPANGTVAVIDGGSGLTYRPDKGYCNEGGSPDEFAYTLNGDSTGTVSVTVACLEEGPPPVQLSATPALTPAFDRSIDDYYLSCTGAPLDLSAEAGPGYTISIDGAAPQAGIVEATVPLGAGEEFSFTVSRLDGRHRYFVRCLPPDFPAWSYTRFTQPSHDLYIAAPTLGAADKYVVVFDDHGVPVWWYKEPNTPFDVKIFPEGNIGWTEGANAVDIRSFDGELQRKLETVGIPFDVHDVQQLDNGNVLLVSYPVREHVDMTAYGGGTDETLFDAGIQELDPQGNVVWEWNSFDHISLDETGRWYAINAGAWKPDTQWDVVHLNAVEPDGEDALLISLRHTDAVYKISKDTGDVIWKLGGTTTPQSLTVLDDPQGAYPMGGQHDVRLQPDGTITISDNNTGLASPPRAVRYEIDEDDMTATLVEQVTDPEITTSNCCGSARRSSDGSWLMSWGGRPLVTEFNAAGERTFKLAFQQGIFSYRAVYVPDGLVSVDQLRAGMDAMHPRP